MIGPGFVAAVFARDFAFIAVAVCILVAFAFGMGFIAGWALS